MQTNRIAKTGLTVSRLALGCAGLAPWNRDAIGKAEISSAVRLIHAACEQGITLFDLADVYAFGKSELTFGEVLKQSPGLRDRIVIQSKCGQCLSEKQFPGPIRADLSSSHILGAVEGSLRRLATDRLDVLLLHAVDALMQPDEVAQAFDELHRQGKVLHFGVSNFDPNQIALLKKSVRQELVINQIRIGLGSPELLIEGMELTCWLMKGDFRTPVAPSMPRSGGIDYCRLHDIQVQAHSPLHGIVGLSGAEDREFQVLKRVLSKLAQQKNTSTAAVALAWLLGHPAGIVPVFGSTSPEHLIGNCAADSLALSRDEWYDLFVAASC